MKQTKMATLSSLFGTLMLLLLLLVSMNDEFVVEAVMEFKVGDDFGWQEPGQNNPFLYSQWATRNRFHVDDSLSFEYKNDSVVEVDKWGYYHCNASKGVAIGFNNGKSVLFKLERAGQFYFISGTIDHCKNGQRLLVEVMPQDSYLAPGPLPSSGLTLVSATLYSVFTALVAIIA